MRRFLRGVTSPESGSISPEIILSNVDLPLPLGPISPIRSPSLTVNETSRKSVVAPKVLVTDWALSNSAKLFSLLAGGAGGVHVFLVGALEVFDGALVEVPDARCDFVDEVVIVGDEQHRAFILLKRDIEGIDGFEVEMVRRLVEDQDIWLLKHELAEEQARGFSAGESIGGLEPLFTTEEHLPEDAADLFFRDLGVPLMEPVGDGETMLDHPGVVLGEVADLGFVTPLDVASVESEVLFCEIGRGREQGFDQRSFTQAIAAHERDLFSAHDVGGEAGDDGLVAVALLNTFKLERRFAGGA